MIEISDLERLLHGVEASTGIRCSLSYENPFQHGSIKLGFPPSNPHNSLYFDLERSPMAWRSKLIWGPFSSQLAVGATERHAKEPEWLENTFASITGMGISIRHNLSHQSDLSVESIEIELEAPLTEKEVHDRIKEIERLTTLLESSVILAWNLFEKVSPAHEKPGAIEGLPQVLQCSAPSRSPANRRACLEYHGFSCQACGEALEEKYGEIGRYVIHVHHVRPLSQMSEPEALDPLRDLVPLCPNCHNIVHRTNPPLGINQLRSQLQLDPDRKSVV